MLKQVLRKQRLHFQNYFQEKLFLLPLILQDEIEWLRKYFFQFPFLFCLLQHIRKYQESTHYNRFWSFLLRLNIFSFSLLNLCLSENISFCSLGKIIRHFMTSNCDQSLFCFVFKLHVTPFLPNQIPPVFFNQFYGFFYFHKSISSY